MSKEMKLGVVLILEEYEEFIVEAKNKSSAKRKVNKKINSEYPEFEILSTEEQS